MSRGTHAISMTVFFYYFIILIDLFENYFYLEMRSTHKEKNDELANIEELEKQRVCTEQVRVTNRDADNENLVSKDLKSDSDEDVTSGSESNAGSEAYVMFIYNTFS